MRGAILSRLLLISVCFDRGQGFPGSSAPLTTNSGLRVKCGLYGSCDLYSQFCDPVLAICEDCRKLCSTENALCSKKCQAYLHSRHDALPSTTAALSRDGLMDLHAEWTTFKNQTIAFRCSVVVFLLALLMGHIATLIWKCWLQPRYRPSARVTSCSCGQLPLSSTDHCSSPERSLLVPKPSSSSSDEKSGPIQTSKDLNGLPANGYPLTHVQIINADCDHACRHTDRCIGLIGLTCGCNQSIIGHSLQQETVTKSLED